LVRVISSPSLRHEYIQGLGRIHSPSLNGLMTESR
jgi:hypothetical protein